MRAGTPRPSGHGTSAGLHPLSSSYDAGIWEMDPLDVSPIVHSGHTALCLRSTCGPVHSSQPSPGSPGTEPPKPHQQYLFPCTHVPTFPIYLLNSAPCYSSRACRHSRWYFQRLTQFLTHIRQSLREKSNRMPL